MAGPEPYPQYKATDEELKRHAEARKASSAQARPSRSSASSGRKRYVRTEAGAKRYRKPVGSEIGTARNSAGAEAQKDSESTDRYSALVGSDRQAQSAAMRSLNDDQLQRLSRVAYSFRSSNPDVVRLRIGVAGELARRGFNVRDFGGLSGKGSPSRTPDSSRARDRAKDRSRGRVTQNDTQKAMAAMYGPNRKVNLSTPEQLRKALGVWGRVRPQQREKVARLLVRRSVELSATHFLGRSIIEAANLPEQEKSEVIELAGKWRHGWIPLNAAAVSSKMKGKTGGKKWWGAPKGGNGGSRGRKATDGRVLNNQATENRYKSGSRAARLQWTKDDDDDYFGALGISKDERPERSKADDDDYFAALGEGSSARGSRKKGSLTAQQRASFEAKVRKHNADKQAKGGMVNKAFADVEAKQNARRARVDALNKEGRNLGAAPKISAKQREEAGIRARRNAAQRKRNAEFEAGKAQRDAAYNAGASKRAAAARAGTAEMEESRRGPERIPGRFGTGEKFEWRKQSDGTYTRYINGRKSPKMIDQGYTLAQVRAKSGSGDSAARRAELDRLLSKPVGQRTPSDYKKIDELRKSLQDPALQRPGESASGPLRRLQGKGKA